VTGVDASPGLIDLCRAGFPEQAWVVADRRGLDLERRFDGLLAWYSAFHLTEDDQKAMAAVYARHVAPGGGLMFGGGPRRGVAMGEWMGRPLHHASLDPAEYHAGLERAGFSDVEERVLKPKEDEGARVWTARRKTSDLAHDRKTEQSDVRSDEEGPGRQARRRVVAEVRRLQARATRREIGRTPEHGAQQAGLPPGVEAGLDVSSQ